MSKEWVPSKEGRVSGSMERAGSKDRRSSGSKDRPEREESEERSRSKESKDSSKRSSQTSLTGSSDSKHSATGLDRGRFTRSTASMLKKEALAELEAIEEAELARTWDYTNARHFAQQLSKACRRRFRAARGVVAAAAAREVHEGWGKTKSAQTLSDLWLVRRRGVRNYMRDAMQDLHGKFFGSASGRQRCRRASLVEERPRKPGFGVQAFIIHNPGDIDEFFDVQQDEMKAGGSAKVYRGVERATHVARAVKKIYKRDPSDFGRLVQEVAIMKQLDHPNVIKLFETFENERHLYLVLELCEGGDVFDRVMTSGAFAEYRAGVIIRTILMTLNYLHSNGYVHRDIKPENVLFKEHRPEPAPSTIRLCDFGYSKNLTPGQEMTTKVGSTYYLAPEVLNGMYSQKCDLWSTGAMCFLLLCGYPPFCGNSDAHTLNLIKKGKFIFHKTFWQNVSKPAKHLIRHLLEVDPDKRMCVRKALEHPWIKSRGVVKIERIREKTVDRLISFHTYHRLRRSAMLALAYQLETQDVRGLLDLFQGLDLNGDGLLTTDEFCKAVHAICGVDETFIQDMMRSVDADGSGVIDFSEFLAATLEKDMFIKNHAALIRAFRCFDQDDSGGLSKDDVAETLCMEGDELYDEVEKLFAEVDTDGNGIVDYREFHSMLQEEIDLHRAIYKEGPTQIGDEDDDDEEAEEEEAEEEQGGVYDADPDAYKGEEAPRSGRTGSSGASSGRKSTASSRRGGASSGRRASLDSRASAASSSAASSRQLSRSSSSASSSS